MIKLECPQCHSQNVKKRGFLMSCLDCGHTARRDNFLVMSDDDTQEQEEKPTITELCHLIVDEMFNIRDLLAKLAERLGLEDVVLALDSKKELPRPITSLADVQAYYDWSKFAEKQLVDDILPKMPRASLHTVTCALYSLAGGDLPAEQTVPVPVWTNETDHLYSKLWHRANYLNQTAQALEELEKFLARALEQS